MMRVCACVCVCCCIYDERCERCGHLSIHVLSESAARLPGAFVLIHVL